MREAALDQLALFAEELGDVPQWQGLARFFDLRARGIRREAFARLDEFLDSAEHWPFEERLPLVRRIAGRESRIDHTLLLPQPLAARLVSPTLWEWLEHEPLSADAHYFTAVLAIWPDDGSADPASALKQAIALDPAHDRAREKLVHWLTGYIDYNQHELPRFYLGDAEADLRDLAKVEAIAAGIRDPHLRGWAQDYLRELREITEAWLACGDGGKTEFAEWFAEAAARRRLSGD